MLLRIKRKHLLLLPAAALAAALASWAHGRRARNAPAATVKAEKGALEVWFREIGEIEPKTKVDVKSTVTGKVVKIFVAEGESVRRGQSLAVVHAGRNQADGYLPATVVSPIDGVVIRRKVEVGDAVVSGLAEFGAGAVLATVADLSRMIVKLEVNEVDVARLRLGQPAQIAIDAFPGESFEGRIASIAPMADKNEQKIRVFRTEVEIERRDARLRPGMSAAIKVLVARRDSTVSVPLEALFEEGDGWRVYLPAPYPDRPPVARKVRLGLQNELRAEIVSGLAGRESLLLEKPKG